MLVAVGLEHIYIIGRNIRETSMIYSGLVFKGSDREKERGYKLYTNASKNNRWLLFVISEWFAWN